MRLKLFILCACACSRPTSSAIFEPDDRPGLGSRAAAEPSSAPSVHAYFEAYGTWDRGTEDFEILSEEIWCTLDADGARERTLTITINDWTHPDAPIAVFVGLHGVRGVGSYESSPSGDMLINAYLSVGSRWMEADGAALTPRMVTFEFLGPERIEGSVFVEDFCANGTESPPCSGWFLAQFVCTLS